MERSRKKSAFLVALTILLGLFSRTRFIPEIIFPYLGDTLYALMIFFIVGFIFPKMDSWKTAFLSFSICSLIECSQLLDLDWLNQIRSYKLGGLILGYGFLWSDILAYGCGGIVGYLFERFFLMKDKS